MRHSLLATDVEELAQFVPPVPPLLTFMILYKTNSFGGTAAIARAAAGRRRTLQAKGRAREEFSFLKKRKRNLFTIQEIWYLFFSSM